MESGSLPLPVLLHEAHRFVTVDEHEAPAPVRRWQNPATTVRKRADEET